MTLEIAQQNCNKSATALQDSDPVFLPWGGIAQYKQWKKLFSGVHQKPDRINRSVN
jgi:hypothetical protein